MQAVEEEWGGLSVLPDGRPAAKRPAAEGAAAAEAAEAAGGGPGLGGVDRLEEGDMMLAEAEELMRVHVPGRPAPPHTLTLPPSLAAAQRVCRPLHRRHKGPRARVRKPAAALPARPRRLTLRSAAGPDAGAGTGAR